VADAEQLFHSVPSSGAGWRPVRWRNAAAHTSPDGSLHFPAREFDIGRLQVASAWGKPVPAVRVSGSRSDVPPSASRALRSAFLSAAEPVPGSRTAVVFSGNTVEIRLPYTLLQFTDPSACRVMDDNRATPEVETTISEGIAVAVSVAGELTETKRFRWKPWTTPPATTERKKASYFILQNAFKNR